MTCDWVSTVFSGGTAIFVIVCLYVVSLVIEAAIKTAKE
jgi:hypothetical protein